MSLTNRIVFSLSLASAATLFVPKSGAEVPIPDEYKQGGFAIGAQAYSFNRFTLFEAIDKTAAAGGKIIELFPDQKLSKDEPNLKCNHNATDDVLEKTKAKLKANHIMAVNYGVVGIPKDEAGARKIFEFAKKMGLRAITTESVDAIDTFEKLVKEYDIMVGFHDHPKQPNNPNYKMWDPNYILSVVKDRDKRIGSCADTGHWLTSNVDPIEALHILNGRIISSHMKDRDTTGPKHIDVPFGNGVGKIGELLEELRRQNFQGNISIEYEYNWDNNVTDVAQCVAFVRGYGAAKGWK